jgi:hypothetical protein
MPSDPDDVTRLVLTIAIWATFIGSILTLIFHPVPEGNRAAIAQVMTTLGSAVALVTNYYFKKRR